VWRVVMNMEVACLFRGSYCLQGGYLGEIHGSRGREVLAEVAFVAAEVAGVPGEAQGHCARGQLLLLLLPPGTRRHSTWSFFFPFYTVEESYRVSSPFRRTGDFTQGKAPNQTRTFLCRLSKCR
jgi:hypothetical protein